MRGQHDDAVLLAREAHDEVAHRDRADRRVGGEHILFKLVVLEMVAEKLFGLQMAGTGGPARADGHKLPGILKSFTAVEVSLGGRSERKYQEHSRNHLFPKQNQIHLAASLASLALRRDGCTHQATAMPTM